MRNSELHFKRQTLALKKPSNDAQKLFAKNIKIEKKQNDNKKLKKKKPGFKERSGPKNGKKKVGERIVKL